MERVWPRVWQVACREEEIANVGDYVNYEIGEESILAVRNAPGSIKAFYNVCPHRDRRLRDDARGNVKAISCGYHGWTFDLDGKEPKISQEIYRNLADFKGKNPILEQDFANMLVVHKGTRSRGWKGARPNPFQESNVYNLHRVVHQYIYTDEK